MESGSRSTFKPSGAVLVTGASGHVGANVVRRLLREDAALRLLVLPGEAKLPFADLPRERVELVEGDVRDAASVQEAMAGCSHVFHVAAKLSTHTATAKEEREIWDVNVMGTKHVVRAAMEAKIERMVFTGSFSSVGFDPDDPARAMNEDAPFYPFFPWLPYARTKVLAELEVMKGVARGLDCVIATSCACIGPNDFVPSRLGGVLQDYAHGKLRAYISGGFDFVSASDLAEGHLLAMNHGRRGEKYVFSSAFMTLGELLDIYGDVCGHKLRLMELSPSVMSAVANVYYGVFSRIFPQLPQRLTPGAVAILRMHRKADISKAKTELGYRPTAVRDAVQDAYDFFVKHGMIQPNASSRRTHRHAAAQHEAHHAESP